MNIIRFSKRSLVLALAATALTTPILAADLKSDTDKFSYTVGLNLGTTFKAQSVQVNPDMVLKGLQDGLAAHKPLLSKSEQQAVMQQYQKVIMAKIQAERNATAQQNSDSGTTFLANNAKQKGVVTTASGLQYKIIKAGSGASPSASDTVTVQYEGSLINGTVFDSSYKRGQPATFAVNQVIPGWTEALQMMKPGAMWMLYIPAKLAYGEQAVGDMIPPNSTLIFKVELLSVNKN